MDWVKRMNLILDYIEKNLDGEIDDEKIVMLSAVPKGMFQRIFAVITDMTLSEYIRKRRLTQAAFDIQSTDEKIIDIAMKYGYDSATAFSAAFKKFHGITPSDAKNFDVSVQSFQRLTFMLTLSVKGGNDMQYRIIENAEDILQKMADKTNSWEFLRNVSERNGTKFACDGRRMAIILPEDKSDWNLDDAYFETGDEETPKSGFHNIFNQRNDSCFNLEISKIQAAGLAALLEHLDDLKDDFKLFSENKEHAVCLDVDTMELTKIAEAKELTKNSDKRIIGFNARYLKEALNFVMCSNDEYIEIYYNGNSSAFIMKSSCLYVAVLPLIMR